MTYPSFTIDIDAIRQQARRDMRTKVVTGTGSAGKVVIDVLNDVLATEIVSWMRYSRHSSPASFGIPDFDPGVLATRSRTSYGITSGPDLSGVLLEDLAANRIVISTHQEVIGWLGDGDITTSRMLKSILAKQEAHTGGILSLLGGLKVRS